jgi:hypothetical protein
MQIKGMMVVFISKPFRAGSGAQVAECLLAHLSVFKTWI